MAFFIWCLIVRNSPQGLGEIPRDKNLLHPCTHLSHAVGKQESYVVADFPQQGHGLLVIFLRLSTEASNEITA